jgi:protocatechuate 3,4-dioxygenase beta subunit
MPPAFYKVPPRVPKMTRRTALSALGAVSSLVVLGCGDDGSDVPAVDAGDGPDADPTRPDGAEACSDIPEETAGPYPGDGSNGANALALAGIVRRDIRSSIAGASATAEGVLLTITLKVVDASASCAPLAGRAVYLWHCDREGRYSMYSSGVTGENYLRGVQETDADGNATFTTVFPGCYTGRMPHMHFEIFPSVAVATSAQGKIATSQVAFPTDVCDDVYATAGYEQSVSNFARVSFDSDNVFSDGHDTQLAAIAGSVDSGYSASLTVGV